MKALFVHDHIFYKKGNDYYSPGGLPAAAWNRYIKNVDQLFILSRGSIDDKKQGLIKSSREGVEFDLFFDVKGGLDYYRFRQSIDKKLRSYIELVDFVIIRVPSTIGYFAYLLCREMKKPYICEVVGCAWDSTWNYGSFFVKLQAPIRFFQMKNVVKNSFAATYVTEFFLQKRYPTNAKIVTYASNVHIPGVNNEIRNNHLNQLKSSSENGILKIGIIGNLNVRYKGFDIALKALKKLKQSSPETKFEFLLVGGGDQVYVRSLIETCGLDKESRIIGRLTAGEEIFQFLDGLDLYLHPSKQEGLPRSVIEAMSRACPVLASNVAGIPELVEERFLHNPGDYNKLYQDLKEVLLNKNLRVLMAEKNFEKSKEYLQDVLENRRQEFFKKIVSEIKMINT